MNRDPLMICWSSSPTAIGNTRSSSPHSTSCLVGDFSDACGEPGFPERKVFSDGHNRFDEPGELPVAIGPLEDGWCEECRVMHHFS